MAPAHVAVAGDASGCVCRRRDRARRALLVPACHRLIFGSMRALTRLTIGRGCLAGGCVRSRISSQTTDFSAGRVAERLIAPVLKTTGLAAEVAGKTATYGGRIMAR
jgi:hypothetical protein